MNQIEFLRRRIFKVNQIEFARIVGVGQATVSRWEDGKGSPTLEQVRSLRFEAANRGIAWDNNWLFFAPPVDAVTGERPAA
jgi:transcriptional regulator with XRE-family HTH domain